jgi:hypothetical protein
MDHDHRSFCPIFLQLSSGGVCGEACSSEYNAHHSWVSAEAKFQEVSYADWIGNWLCYASKSSGLDLDLYLGIGNDVAKPIRFSSSG